MSITEIGNSSVDLSRAQAPPNQGSADEPLPIGRKLIPAAAAVGLFYPLFEAWNYVAVSAAGLATILLTAANLVFLILLGGVDTRTSLLRLERWLLVLGGLVLVVYAAGTLAGSSGYATDEAALQQGAAHALLHGHDPYGMNLMRSIWAYMSPGLMHTTQLLNGQSVDTYSYPALPMLIVAPFVALTGDGQAVPIACTVATILAMVMMFRLLPEDFRTLSVLVCVGFMILSLGSAAGTTEIFAMVPLIYVAARWTTVGSAGVTTRSDQLNAVALGLAMCSNQVAWFIAPFVVIGIALINLGRLSRARALRIALTYLLFAALAFLFVNGLFILTDPHAWFDGVLAPVIQRALPLGQGVISLSLFAGLGGGDIRAFDYAAVAALIGLLIAYGVWFHKLGRATFVLALIPLFLSPRSFGSYWMMFIAVIVISFASDGAPIRGAWQGAAWLPRPAQMSVAGICMLPVALCLAVAVVTPGPLAMTVLRMQGSQASGLVTQIRLAVTNHSRDPVSAEFTVTSIASGGLTPFWKTMSGPRTLAAGASATYTIAAPDGSVAKQFGHRFRVEALTQRAESVSVSNYVVAGIGPGTQ